MLLHCEESVRYCLNRELEKVEGIYLNQAYPLLHSVLSA